MSTRDLVNEVCKSDDDRTKLFNILREGEDDLIDLGGRKLEVKIQPSLTNPPPSLVDRIKYLGG